MTRLKSFLAIFSYLLAVEANALKVQGDILSEVSIKSRPSYFFKASSDGAIIAYNYNYDGRSDSEGVNKLYFLDTKQTINIPGPWDPVFIHDSDLMVIPYNDNSGVYYNFYKISELKDKWRTARPIFKDRSLNGYYQSVGILDRNSSFIDFRVIAEGKSNAHLMRDYRYDLRTKKMSALRGARPFCSRFSIKLPMMSKDGKELAGINQRTSTTNIFSIDNNGRCRVVADLGKKTGKVNFSYDGSRITYHIYSTKNTRITDGFVRTPSDDYTADVYIYDRTTREERRLTYNKKDNSLYPEFLKDGNMIFINYPHRSNEKVSFYTVRAKKPQNYTLEFSKFSDWIHPDKLGGGDTLSYSVNAPLPISSVVLAARNSEVEISSIKLLLKNGRVEQLDFSNQLMNEEELSIDIPAKFSSSIHRIIIQAKSLEDDSHIRVKAELGELALIDDIFEQDVKPTRKSGGEKLIYSFKEFCVKEIRIRPEFGKIQLHDLSLFSKSVGIKSLEKYRGKFVEKNEELIIPFEGGNTYINGISMQVEGWQDDRVRFDLEVKTCEQSAEPTDPIADEPDDSVVIIEREKKFKALFDGVIEKKCLSCHSDFSSQKTIPEYYKIGLPGEEPPLLKSIISGKMPMAADKLSEDEIKLFKTWLDSL